MALDFPANPTNGQIYDSYVYNSTVGAWQAREDSATVATTSPTAPATANNGDLWYNSNTGVSYVYYADGSSAQWVEIISSAVPLLNIKANIDGGNLLTGAQSITSTSATQIPLVINGIASQSADLQQWKNSGGTVLAEIDSAGALTTPRVISTVATGTAPLTVSSTTAVTNLNADLLDGQHGSVYSPAGMVSQFAGASAPTGWLLCDGSAVSRTTFANLFSAIGTAYGTGDGSTTFNLPNLKGKVPVGLDPADTSFDAVGETGGEKAVTLQTTHVPSHTHTFSGTTSGESGHTHTVYGLSAPTGSGSGYLGLQSDSNLVWYRGNGTNWASGGGAGGSIPAINVGGNMSNSTSGSTGHTHTYSGTTSTGSGSGTAHNNLQPYIVMNYIIKT